MSNIFITDIIGTGTYAVPANDTALANATAGLTTLLSGVTGLSYDRILAWVEDAGGPGGAEGNRTLNCLVEKFLYNAEECPDETEVDTLTAAIETALEADANITSVDQQQVHIFQTGAYHLWQRDATGGFLYPTTITDDVCVGGYVAPTGKWFDDGDLVLGGNTMSGAEKLRVVGDERVEGVVITNDGAVGTPAHAFLNDTNTGIYRSASDTLAFSTGGTQRGYFSSLGLYVANELAVGRTTFFANEQVLSYGQDDIVGSASSPLIGYLSYLSKVAGNSDADYKAGFKSYLYNNGTATGYSYTWTGFYSEHVVAVDQDVDTARGLFAIARVTNASASINTFEGVRIDPPTGSGDISNAYGISIGDLTSGGVVSASYGIYQEGTNDQNIFLGPTAIGAMGMVGSEIFRVAGNIRLDGLIQSNDGAVGGPAYSFISDTNTGMYRSGADTLSFAAGGSQIFYITTAGATLNGKLTVTGLVDPTGMVFDDQATVPGGAPGAGKGTLWAKNDSPTTIWFTDSGGTDHQLAYSATSSYWTRAGTVLSPATAGDTLTVGDGTAGAPAYSFASDTNIGFYRIGADEIGVSAGGTKIADFNSAWSYLEGTAGQTFGLVRIGIHGSGTSVGTVLYRGRDATNTVADYASASGYCISDVNGSETGAFLVKTATAAGGGFLGDHFAVSGGVIVGDYTALTFPAAGRLVVQNAAVVGRSTMYSSERFLAYSNSDSFDYGITSFIEKTTATALESKYGINSYIYHSGAVGASVYVGFDSVIEINPAQTLTIAYGYRTAFLVNNASGVITTGYGVYIDGPSGPGVVTNSYGLRIQAQNGGTLSYGIYQDGTADLNVLRGDVVIGGTAMSSTELLRVVGAARIEGKLTVTGLIDPTGMVFDDQASVPGGAPGAGKGTIWAKNDSPTTIWFTDSGGTDHQLAYSATSSYWTRAGTVLSPTTAGDTLTVGDGAVGAPAYSFSSDTNCGIYRSAADTISFACAGARAFYITGTVCNATRNGGAPILGTERSDTHGAPAILGNLIFNGRNASGASFDYSSFQGYCIDDTATNEDGAILARTIVAGASTTQMYIHSGVVIGSSLSTLGGTGRLYVQSYTGIGVTPVAETYLNVSDDNSTETLDTIGINVTLEKTTTSNKSYARGVVVTSNYTGTGDITGLMCGVDVDNFGPATAGAVVTNLYGFRAYLQHGAASVTTKACFEGGAATGAGTSTTAYGLRILDLDGTTNYGAYISGQSGTSNYGIYIGAHGAGTTRYGVYQAGGSDDNYFAGNVGINQAVPGWTLEVNGQAYIVDELGVGDNPPTANAGIATFRMSGTAANSNAVNVDAYSGAALTNLRGIIINRSIGHAVTNSFGIVVSAPTGAGSMTGNLCGIYIGAHDLGIGETPWGILQVGSTTNNWFAGCIVVGGTTTALTPTSVSCGMEIQSTTKAFLPSRMTTTQRDALTEVVGMVIWNTTTSKLQVCTATGSPGTWADLH